LSSMEIPEKDLNESGHPAENDDNTSGRKKGSGIISIILRGVALAMGVLVITLSWLDKKNADTAILMLGIGLMCLAIDNMHRKDNA